MSSTNDSIARYRIMSIGNYKKSPYNDAFNDKMSLNMDKDFSEFLTEEMQRRGWTQADLAKAAGVNRQVISTYVNRQRQKPDIDVLIAISRALHIAPENVLRAAGLLPPASENIAEKEDLLHLFDQMSKEKKKDLLNYAQFLIAKKE